MARENCTRAVELLGEDEPGEGVGEGEGSEREQEAGTRARGVRPSVGGSDGEDDVLSPFVAPDAEPGGKGFGGHLPASTVEQDGDCGGSALLAIEPLEEGIGSLEGFGVAASKDRAAFEIEGGEGIKLVLGGGPGAYVGESEEHREEDKSRGCEIPKNERHCPFLE